MTLAIVIGYIFYVASFPLAAFGTNAFLMGFMEGDRDIRREGALLLWLSVLCVIIFFLLAKPCVNPTI